MRRLGAAVLRYPAAHLWEHCHPVSRSVKACCCCPRARRTTTTCLVPTYDENAAAGHQPPVAVRLDALEVAAVLDLPACARLLACPPEGRQQSYTRPARPLAAAYLDANTRLLLIPHAHAGAGAVASAAAVALPPTLLLKISVLDLPSLDRASRPRPCLRRLRHPKQSPSLSWASQATKSQYSNTRRGRQQPVGQPRRAPPAAPPRKVCFFSTLARSHSWDATLIS